jgi:hypothetical protein
MAVSMKLGVTVLMQIPRDASLSARASTYPISAALLVA